MEEKNITWEEIDAEMEAIVEGLAASLKPMVKRLKELNERIKNAPEPVTTEEKILKALCVNTCREYSKCLQEFYSHDNLWTESKEQAAKAVEKFLGL